MRWILLFLTLFAGCTRLPPGRADAIAGLPPRVYLIRGYLDWYSAGIDDLATELRATAIPAESFREDQWQDLETDLIAVGHPRPLVLIGFSYGADDAITIARDLNDRQVPVDLLITIDPVTPANVPANVKRCVSFYEPNGFWDLFPWLRGVPLQGDTNVTPPTNINIRDRVDLDEPDTSHSTIAGNPRLHQFIIKIVKQTLATPTRR